VHLSFILVNYPFCTCVSKLNDWIEAYIQIDKQILDISHRSFIQFISVLPKLWHRFYYYLNYKWADKLTCLVAFTKQWNQDMKQFNFTLYLTHCYYEGWTSYHLQKVSIVFLIKLLLTENLYTHIYLLYIKVNSLKKIFNYRLSSSLLNNLLVLSNDNYKRKKLQLLICQYTNWKNYSFHIYLSDVNIVIPAPLSLFSFFTVFILYLSVYPKSWSEFLVGSI
jgi:hypothetical protein